MADWQTMRKISEGERMQIAPSVPMDLCDVLAAQFAAPLLFADDAIAKIAMRLQQPPDASPAVSYAERPYMAFEHANDAEVVLDRVLGYVTRLRDAAHAARLAAVEACRDLPGGEQMTVLAELRAMA